MATIQATVRMSMWSMKYALVTANVAVWTYVGGWVYRYWDVIQGLGREAMQWLGGTLM